MIKVNNNNWKFFTRCSIVSIANFKQVVVGWVKSNLEQLKINCAKVQVKSN